MGGKELRGILGVNLKLFRSHRSWSQADLAERAGISITFLSSIERGNKWPHPETLSNLAQAFGIEAYELIKPKPDVSGDVASAIAKYTEEATIVMSRSLEQFCKEYIAR
jgi:transcriptional regulator with XRE-family HTH domain